MITRSCANRGNLSLDDMAILCENYYMLIIKNGVISKMEIWKQIEDYPYEVSNLGRIKSYNNTRSKKTKIINGTIMKNGYRTIAINKKKYYIHRLVAMAFVDGYKEGLHVNHKNGNKLDNHFSNLEWVTNAENVRHSWKNGLVNIKGMRYVPTEEQKE